MGQRTVAPLGVTSLSTVMGEAPVGNTAPLP